MPYENSKLKSQPKRKVIGPIYPPSRMKEWKRLRQEWFENEQRRNEDPAYDDPWGTMEQERIEEEMYEIGMTKEDIERLRRQDIDQVVREANRSEWRRFMYPRQKPTVQENLKTRRQMRTNNWND